MLVRSLYGEEEQMKRAIVLLFAVFFVGVATSLVAHADVPMIITYQGELSDGDGNPVDGERGIDIYIFDEQTGGTLLWQETQNVTVVNGLFTVKLGEDTENPLDPLFDQQYWLGISIAGGDELSPRTPLTTAPYSVRAKYIDLLTEANIQQFWALVISMPDADGDGYTKVSQGGDDCDDFNPDIHPGADEICDGEDNDCDGTIDNNAIDCPEGFICMNAECVIADADGDGYNVDVDCDDNNPEVYPGAPELCDGLDNDCNDEIDDNTVDCPGGTICLDGVCVTYDNDGDGWPSDQDCDDNNPEIYPGAPELCDGLDNDCNSIIDDDVVDCPSGTICVDGYCIYEDADGDGWPSDQDCDDSDPNINPGMPEICDYFDNNCDGNIDDVDDDADGYYCFDDCDDNNPEIYPGAPEYCDGLDNDCNTIIDDDVVDCPSGTICQNGSCTYVDADGDGWPSDQDCDDGDPNTYPGAPEFCDGVDRNCNGIVWEDMDSDGWPCNLDCDDANPNTYPGAPEICGDALDNDCDGQVDFIDVDGDSYNGCFDDCDDTDPNVYPGAPEFCDGIDRNCNGTIWDDMDSDGWPCNLDCNDGDPSIYPGAPEFCDGIDRNCNGTTWEDMDSDGWPCNQDCDDTRSDVYPGAPELCDGVDNDCDTLIDEGCP